MDEGIGELPGLPGEGPSDLSSDDLVYIRDQNADDGVVHRVDVTWGSGDLEARRYTTHCRLQIPLHATLWTKSKPTCVVCIGVGDPEP